MKILKFIIFIGILIFLLIIFRNNIKTKFSSIDYNGLQGAADAGLQTITSGEAATKNSPDIIFNYINPNSYCTNCYTVFSQTASFRLPYIVLFDLGISSDYTLGIINSNLTSTDLNGSTLFTNLNVPNQFISNQGITVTTNNANTTKTLYTIIDYSLINSLNNPPGITSGSNNMYTTDNPVYTYKTINNTANFVIRGDIATIRYKTTIEHYYAFGIAIVNNISKPTNAQDYNQYYPYNSSKFVYVLLYLDINKFVVILRPGEVSNEAVQFGQLDIR